MQIFFSVGEPSGDQHAAHLIEELRRRRTDIDVVGYGGPLMERAGCRIEFPLTNLAVMGLLRVFPLLRQFYLLVRLANRFFHEHRPAAVVLIDFPGFNWWIARQAKKAGIPVFYYLPPQLWAWAPWRVNKMRRFVDHVLCALPFEQQWYAERGIEVEYVGHPFFDEVADYSLDQDFLTERQMLNRRKVGILPGSRNFEVRRNWPLMIEVMQRLHAEHADVSFYVACYRASHRDFCRQSLNAKQLNLPVELHVGKTPEIIELAECCLMVSGSVSLELLARKTPAVVTYRIGPLMRLLSFILLRCKYVTLPNLFADRELMPEFVYTGSPASSIRQVTNVFRVWLGDRQQLAEKTAELTELRERYFQTGATGRTAEAILKRLPPAEQRHAA